VIEKAKARAFLDGLGEAEIDIKGELSPDLKNRESEILRRIRSVINRLSDENLSAEERRSNHEEYIRAENEYMLLVSQMQKENPMVTKPIFPQPCSLEDVQSELLEKKTAILEYFLGEKRSYLLLIQKRNLSLFLLPARKEMEKSIKGYIKEISDPPQKKFRGSFAGKRLYKVLFSFIEDYLEANVEKLVIIPDGFLYFLPFETLACESDNKGKRGKFLIEKYEISYAPSCSSLFFIKKRKQTRPALRSLLAIGNPDYSVLYSRDDTHKHASTIMKEIYEAQGVDFQSLPHSEKEIKKISRFFKKKQKKVLLGKEAREGNIKKTHLQDYQIIHFACHGVIDENMPSRSALVLSFNDDPGEDGFLLVREIHRLGLAAELVVLSACQTGRGKLENMEGVLGLPRIFFYSGAKAVISSLWRIRDESSAIFMANFYKNLSSGRSKSQALRMAKIKMLESRYSHPFYWAPFVLYGDSSPLSKPKQEESRHPGHSERENSSRGDSIFLPLGK